jgi:hypothetical protein
MSFLRRCSKTRTMRRVHQLTCSTTLLYILINVLWCRRHFCMLIFRDLQAVDLESAYEAAMQSYTGRKVSRARVDFNLLCLEKQGVLPLKKQTLDDGGAPNIQGVVVQTLSQYSEPKSSGPALPQTDT